VNFSQAKIYVGYVRGALLSYSPSSLAVSATNVSLKIQRRFSLRNCITQQSFFGYLLKARSCIKYFVGPFIKERYNTFFRLFVPHGKLFNRGPIKGQMKIF
jgi:hypothetical protein